MYDRLYDRLSDSLRDTPQRAESTVADFEHQARNPEWSWAMLQLHQNGAESRQSNEPKKYLRDQWRDNWVPKPARDIAGPEGGAGEWRLPALPGLTAKQRQNFKRLWETCLRSVASKTADEKESALQRVVAAAHALASPQVESHTHQTRAEATIIDEGYFPGLDVPPAQPPANIAAWPQRGTWQRNEQATTKSQKPATRLNTRFCQAFQEAKAQEGYEAAEDLKVQASEHPTEPKHAMATVRSAATVATKVEIESITNQESKSLEEEESEPVASRVIACDFRYDPYSDPSSAKSDQAYKERCRHNLVGARPNRQCIKD